MTLKMKILLFKKRSRAFFIRYQQHPPERFSRAHDLAMVSLSLPAVTVALASSQSYTRSLTYLTDRGSDAGDNTKRDNQRKRAGKDLDKATKTG